jgi:nitric oxide reductase subunit C
MLKTLTLGSLAVVTVLAATAGSARAGADEGKALYETKCKVCHSVGGAGGKMADKGGALDGVGSKRDAAWLTKYLTDPKSAMPDAKMPKIKMTESEMADYVAYLLTLK